MTHDGTKGSTVSKVEGFLVTMGKNHGDLQKDAESEWEKRWERKEKMRVSSFFFLRQSKPGHTHTKRGYKWKD